ncbi:MAG TPA: HD domain-containing phosphohydrolase [Bacillota bacterium]|nr:HD domain-containing phosphohydrolase [Bacillota bacterium]
MDLNSQAYQRAVLQGLYAGIIGLMLPVVVTVVLLTDANLAIRWQNFWQIHFSHGAFVLLDVVPVAFGLLVAKLALEQQLAEARDKKAQQTIRELREQLSQWQIIHDNTPVAYAIIDRDHRVDYANRYCADLAGVTPEELTGRKCYESFGKGVPCPGCPVMRAFSTRQIQTNTKKEVNSSNEEAIMEQMAVPVLKNGQVDQVIEIVMDVTDQMRFVASRHEELLETINTLVEIIELIDGYTGGHSHRVRQLALRTARALELEPHEILDIEIAACLHDIGKIGLERVILHKPGSLTKREFDEVKQHPVVGAESLQKIPRLNRVAKYVRHHHETWAGAGYPDGLAGEDIPLGSRIIGVSDAFDAMTSDRAYRQAISREHALAEIKAGAGSQFDPQVVKAFLEIM